MGEPLSNQSFAIMTIAAAFLTVAAGAAAKEAGLSNPVQSTPTTLYFHMFDAQNDFPVNTQEPDPKWDRDCHVGIATNSLCFDELSELPPPASQPSADKEWHTLYGYSSPSYVEYDYLENGKPRVHPERGLSFDVQLDQGTEPVLHWYLATQVGAPDSDLPADPDNAPIALPNVVVRAIMRESDKISVDEEAYREGEVILQGQSEPALLAGPASQGPVNWTTTPDGRNVYEIRVPLRIESPEIPRATGYNLQVETFIANEYCDSEGDYAMPSLVDVHTSEGHRPRLELAIMNPVRIEHLHPQVVGDELVIHSALNSPWGN